jgi:hypothetical protein
VTDEEFVKTIYPEAIMYNLNLNERGPGYVILKQPLVDGKFLDNMALSQIHTYKGGYLFAWPQAARRLRNDLERNFLQ